MICISPALDKRWTSGTAWAEKIWDYHQLHHQLSKADAILVLCSHDKAGGREGAQLFLDGWAPLSSVRRARANYERFMERAGGGPVRKIALQMGVPAAKSSSKQVDQHGENVLFYQKAAARKRLIPVYYSGAEAIHGAQELRDI